MADVLVGGLDSPAALGHTLGRAVVVVDTVSVGVEVADELADFFPSIGVSRLDSLEAPREEPLVAVTMPAEQVDYSVV